MNIEKLAIEQKPAIQPLWLVIDENGYPIHCASYKEACHEHINDAINDFDIDGAPKWRVIEASPKAYQAQEGEESQARIAELEALLAEKDAQLGRRNLHKEHEYLMKMQALQATNKKLLDALRLAKVTFVANKMDVRKVMKVINEAIAEAEGKEG